MYHFTDVPMIISGGFFLILDPQQEFLPRNKRQRRKVGVKISLSTARRICTDHLTPFHGVRGFSKDMDHYRGTIFRFPFRGMKATSLKETDFFVDSGKTKGLLDKYFEDASMALLFLKNIKSVELCIRGEEHARWRVSASRSEVSEDEIFGHVKVRSQKEKQDAVERDWRIGMTDIDDCPAHILKPGRGAGKITQCGIAACLSHPETSQRIFCTLPTPFRSCIPVSFHASFAVTGDRRSIPFEDGQRDSAIAEWNNWLLTSCIPDFYLDFLKDIAPRIGEDSFKYWPLITDGVQSTTKLTHAVIKAFWEKVSTNDEIQIYPLARPMHAADGASPLKIRSSGKVRKLHATTSLRRAQFDILPHEKSSQLQSLFLKICPFLVCPPTALGKTMGKTMKSKAGSSMTLLGPNLLSQLFREEENCKILADFYAQVSDGKTGASKAMEVLLEILVEKAGNNPEALNYLSGCRILPKLDGSLGLLKLGSEAGVEWNLLADERERKLFGFAASSFVNTNLFARSPNAYQFLGTSRNPIKDITDSKLNVRPLELQDLGTLLARNDSPLHQAASKDRDSWMERLWEYLNKTWIEQYERAKLDSTKFNPTSLLAISGLQDKPIYRMVGNQEQQYCTPEKFESEAWIVDPCIPKQHVLCLEIKDLRLADQTCLPYWLNAEESNLHLSRSFNRLVRALKFIMRRSNLDITAYLDQTLTRKSREVSVLLLVFLLPAEFLI
jgi:sacsin